MHAPSRSARGCSVAEARSTVPVAVKSLRWIRMNFATHSTAPSQSAATAGKWIDFSEVPNHRQVPVVPNAPLIVTGWHPSVHSEVRCRQPARSTAKRQARSEQPLELRVAVTACFGYTRLRDVVKQPNEQVLVGDDTNHPMMPSVDSCNGAYPREFSYGRIGFSSQLGMRSDCL